jgi:hypothetical protein
MRPDHNDDHDDGLRVAYRRAEAQKESADGADELLPRIPGKATLLDAAPVWSGRAAPGQGTLLSLHRKATARQGGVASGVRPGAALAVSHAASQATESSGTPLPFAIRGRFERSLGVDLGQVRVHTSNASADAAAKVSAVAYAQGHHIHFAAGTYDPSSEQGQRLLAHEVAHTVQQRDERNVAPAGEALDVSQPGDAHEHEADHAAEAMLRGERAGLSPAGGLSRQIQRQGNGADGWQQPYCVSVGFTTQLVPAVDSAATGLDQWTTLDDAVSNEAIDDGLDLGAPNATSDKAGGDEKAALSAFQTTRSALATSRDGLTSSKAAYDASVADQKTAQAAYEEALAQKRSAQNAKDGADGGDDNGPKINWTLLDTLKTLGEGVLTAVAAAATAGAAVIPAVAGAIGDGAVGVATSTAQDLGGQAAGANQLETLLTAAHLANTDVTDKMNALKAQLSQAQDQLTDATGALAAAVDVLSQADIDFHKTIDELRDKTRDFHKALRALTKAEEKKDGQPESNAMRMQRLQILVDKMQEREAQTKQIEQGMDANASCFIAGLAGAQPYSGDGPGLYAVIGGQHYVFFGASVAQLQVYGQKIQRLIDWRQNTAPARTTQLTTWQGIANSSLPGG